MESDLLLCKCKANIHNNLKITDAKTEFQIKKKIKDTFSHNSHDKDYAWYREMLLKMTNWD